MNKKEDDSGLSKQNSPLVSGGQPTLLKTLGVFDGIAILIGITIGAGIYSSPHEVAGYLSSFSPIIALWLLAGVFVFMGGLIYAELGTRIPATGGEYAYITQCFGPFAGFMFGWSQLFIIRTSPAAALAIVSADYLGYFFRMSKPVHTLVAIGIIALLGTLNIVGVRWASFYQKLSTVLKVGGLFALAIIGLVLIRGTENLLATRATPTANLGPVGNVVAAMFLIMFAHTGFERLGYVAGEMKNPRRAIPQSMFIGITIIVVIFVLINFIYHRTLGMEGMQASKVVASATAVKLIGSVGAAFVSLLVIISATGSINGTAMAASRVYYAMARDGLFFKWLNFIHPRFRTPSRAVLAHCVWATVILLLRKTFGTIAAGMVFALLIFYSMSALALIKLRSKGEGNPDAYHLPLYPFIPALYLTFALAMLILRLIFEWKNSLLDLAFIATGLPFSLIWVFRKKNSGTRTKCL